MKNKIEIGQKFKELRKKAGLTLKQASENSGVTYRLLISIEKGTHNFSYDYLIKLAAFYNHEIRIKIKPKNNLKK